MEYKLTNLTEGNKTYYVVASKDGKPVSQKFENRVVALGVLAELLNSGTTSTSLEAPKVEPLAPVEASVIDSKPKAVLSHRAVGMFLGNDGCWMVSTIPYDPFTNQFGDMTSERAGMNRVEGEERFRVTAGKLVLKV